MYNGSYGLFSLELDTLDTVVDNVRYTSALPYVRHEVWRHLGVPRGFYFIIDHLLSYVLFESMRSSIYTHARLNCCQLLVTTT